MALVVQPGVEFADESVVEYSRPKARELVACLKEYPDLALEGHSTDYQPRSCLRELVEDGVAILKVGPASFFWAPPGMGTSLPITYTGSGASGQLVLYSAKARSQAVLRNRDHRREKGVYSCCSANAFVLRAVLRRALAHQAAPVPSSAFWDR